MQTAETKAEAMIDAIFIRPDLNRDFYLVYCDLIGHAARFDNSSAVAIMFHDTAHQMYADVVAMGIQEGVFPARDVYCGSSGTGADRWPVFAMAARS